MAARVVTEMVAVSPGPPTLLTLLWLTPCDIQRVTCKATLKPGQLNCRMEADLEHSKDFSSITATKCPVPSEHVHVVTLSGHPIYAREGFGFTSLAVNRYYTWLRAASTSCFQPSDSSRVLRWCGRTTPGGSLLLWLLLR